MCKYRVHCPSLEQPWFGLPVVLRGTVNVATLQHLVWWRWESFVSGWFCEEILVGAVACSWLLQMERFLFFFARL